MSRPSVYNAQSSILFLILGEGSKTYFIECPKKLASNVFVPKTKEKKIPRSLEKRKERPRINHVLKKEKITATHTRFDTHTQHAACEKEEKKKLKFSRKDLRNAYALHSSYIALT